MPVIKNRLLRRGHKAVTDWSNESLGPDAKPLVEGSDCKIDFTFKAGGHYDLHCLLVAGEPDGMLTLTGSAHLGIANHQARAVLEYCSKNSNAVAMDRNGLIEDKEEYHGIFNIYDGTLIYIHSRPAITEPGDVELINLMMSRMDEAVAAVAEGVLKIIDLKR